MDDLALTHTSVEILKELSVNPNCTTKSFPKEYLPIIRKLAHRRLLTCSPKYIGSVLIWPVRITQLGRDALAEHESSREQLAQDVANQQAEQQRMASERSADIRREYILFFLGLVLGWLLGQITPKDVWGWLTSLIH